MSQRLSRKKIKRDEFMESVGGAFDYVQAHAEKLIGFAIAVLVALILVAVYVGYSEGRQRRADQALSETLRVFRATVDPVAANPADADSPSFASAAARSQRARELFQAVEDDFGGSDAAKISKVYLGQIAVQAGDLETARAYWQDFVSSSRDHALAVEVQVNLMALDRSTGRGDELVTELRAMLSGADAGLPPDLLWYQLGLTLEELDRQGEAREAFQRIVDEYPQSAYAPSARERAGADQSPFVGT